MEGAFRRFDVRLDARTAKIAHAIAYKGTFSLSQLRGLWQSCTILDANASLPIGRSCQNRGERAKPHVIPTLDSPVWASDLKTEGK
ncbi:hypothetical protein DS909_05045 [Phaeobacter gallaeciensis]|uniref:Uncharacterized protein n=1 Tax=Phaeobacter gallaeciensis TaxID=60890 RepID=A0A366X5D2_9RHOB|nr:hypothetical protein DS909_05045 [Phaeobacter gallaeciensis]